MEKEENVYKQATLTEETGAVGANGGDQKDADSASTVLGKFKDVNALARAYGALQAEFTRRSQRLKALERDAEKFANGETGAGRSGVEKLRKNAETRRVENKRFDEFMAQTASQGAGVGAGITEKADPEDLKGTADLEKEQIEQNGSTVYEMNALDGEKADHGEGVKTEGEKEKPLDKQSGKAHAERQALSNAAEGALKGENALPSVAESGDAATDPSELLYAKVCRDENVRLRIIGEYLSSIGRAGAPLMTGGVGVLATPPQKAKSISDAGDMALRFFKKPAVEY